MEKIIDIFHLIKNNPHINHVEIKKYGKTYRISYKYSFYNFQEINEETGEKTLLLRCRDMMDILNKINEEYYLKSIYREEMYHHKFIVRECPRECIEKIKEEK